MSKSIDSQNVKCAWCSETLHDGDDTTTHSICPSCFLKLQATIDGPAPAGKAARNGAIDEAGDSVVR
jgi:hypothetical protein